MFVIYKLRSMYHQCKRLTGPRWSTPGDPRVTPVGKVLRALHLDELPQLVNVLGALASLDGPKRGGRASLPRVVRIRTVQE